MSEFDEGTEGHVPESQEPGPEVFARQVLIGLLIETADLGRRGLSTAGGAAMNAGRFWGALLEPVLSTPLLAPVRRGTQALARRSSQELEHWARLGRESEIRSKDLARQLLHIPVEEVVEILSDDPKTRALVRDQARALLVELADDDDLSTVVRTQGDAYVDHLEEHPDGVQQLLQSQSSNMAKDLANVVRGWVTTLDGWLDHYVDKILRRRDAEDGADSRRWGDDAGFASRLLAFLADFALLSIVTLVGGWVWTSLLQTLGLNPLDCDTASAASDLAGTLCQAALWIGVGVAALFPAAYFLFFWAAVGQTPGKSLAGVRIVGLNGSRIGFAKSALRVAGYAMSFWTFGLGFAGILLNRRHLGWHDRIARTRVVYSWQTEDPANARASTAIDPAGD